MESAVAAIRNLQPLQLRHELSINSRWIQWACLDLPGRWAGRALTGQVVLDQYGQQTEEPYQTGSTVRRLLRHATFSGGERHQGVFKTGVNETMGISAPRSHRLPLDHSGLKINAKNNSSACNDYNSCEN